MMLAKDEKERFLDELVEQHGWIRRGRYVKPGLQFDLRLSLGRHELIMETRDGKDQPWLAQEVGLYAMQKSAKKDGCRRLLRGSPMLRKSRKARRAVADQTSARRRAKG